MELDKTSKEVLLCKECLVKKEYTIPLYHKNETTNEIEYKCSKSHSIGTKDVISMILDDDLIRKLNFCEEHKEKYCAWSEDGLTNLCSYDIGNKLESKQQYLLFIDIYPSTNKTQKLYSQAVYSLRELLNKYLANAPKAIKEIKYLENLIIIFENSWFLLCKHNINNFQVIQNILYSLSIMPSENEIKSLEKEYLMILYGEFIIKMTKKKVIDIDVKELNHNFSKNNKIIQFIGNQNQQYFFNLDQNGFIKIIKMRNNDITYIYNSENNYKFEKGDCILPYNDKIIIVLQDKKLLFIDYINNVTYHLNLSNYLLNANNNINMNNMNFFDINQNNFNALYDELDFLTSENNLIKINMNDILLLHKKRAYIITLDDSLNSITNFQELAEIENVIKACPIFYQKNNIVQKGIIIISNITKDFNSNNYPNLYYNNRKLFLMLYMYDINLKIIQAFNFSIPIGDRYFTINRSEISFNFINDMVLILSEKEIYQISTLTKELIAIYDISQYLDNNIIKSNIFFNYDKQNKKFEQIILLMNKSKDQIYQFNWEEKTIVFHKQYEYKNLIDFIPFYRPDVVSDFSSNEKKSNILICSDRSILFN